MIVPSAVGLRLSDTQQLHTYLCKTFHEQSRESFVSIAFGLDGRCLAAEHLFWGSLRQSMVYPREVLRFALLNNAATLVIAHNHLSGDTRPSQADVRLTRRLRELLHAVEVDLAAHYIVAGQKISVVEGRF